MYALRYVEMALTEEIMNVTMGIQPMEMDARRLVK